MAKKVQSKRGLKACPKCKKRVGARTLKCKCGHEFGAKIRQSKKATSYESQLASLRDGIERRLEEIDESTKELQAERKLVEGRLKQVMKICGD